MEKKCVCNCVLKWIGIVVAVAGAAAGIYFLVSKYIVKKKELEDEDFCSCVCFEGDEEAPAAPQVEDIGQE